MKRIPPAPLPVMRKDGLVIDDLPDEVLVYDLESHKAHCLNRSAALVWRCCDGKSSSADIARTLTAELETQFSEDLVLLALNQLEKLHLLEQPEAMPAQFAVLSRRQMVRRLGFATIVAVPLVTSIVAPTAVQASTCIQRARTSTAGRRNRRHTIREKCVAIASLARARRAPAVGPLALPPHSGFTSAGPVFYE